MATSSPHSATSPDDAWTTRSLLRWMIGHFEAKAIDSPQLVSEMLLAHVLGCERLRLYMESDRPASGAERATLRDLVARAARHEPVQYMLGEAWFFGRPFTVGPEVLIPRPSTETLLEHLLQWWRSRGETESALIADVGTGSGCIAVSIALQQPEVSLLATDRSPEALAVARTNAERHDVLDRIELIRGDLLEPLLGRGPVFDAICSNPPYIPDHEWDDVAPNVKEFEPHMALRAGSDGLDCIRPLIAGSVACLVAGGRLAIEIADCQRAAVIDLAGETGAFRDIEVVTDHEGLNRVLLATKTG